ncbi:hypothetical protein BDD12DRAFT_48956 [Trichophaea hybrida]|nr:hypothetical protein BDD12DRAFT_48956 [Trichophaea hybrida]
MIRMGFELYRLFSTPHPPSAVQKKVPARKKHSKCSQIPPEKKHQTTFKSKPALYNHHRDPLAWFFLSSALAGQVPLLLASPWAIAYIWPSIMCSCRYRHRQR